MRVHMDNCQTKSSQSQIENILSEIETILTSASQRRFTGEISLTFNVSQGGFSTSYVEKEREGLISSRRKIKA